MPAARKERSRIDELGVRKLVEDMFRAKAEYATIIKAVQEQTGQDISDSALSRAHLAWTSKERRIDEAQQRITALVQRLFPGAQATDVSNAGLQLLMNAATERFADAMKSFEDADVLELGWLFNDAVRTAQKAEALKIQRERLDLQRAKVAATAEKVDALGRAKNLDEDTLKKIREEIYGIVPAGATA